MNTATPHGQLSIVNEPAYTFGSADNVRTYPTEVLLGSKAQAVSAHGVLLDGKPIAVVGATGGATGVHDHSALWIDNRLLLAVCDSVACAQLQPLEICWSLRVDDATCFGLHFHEKSGSLLSHGELLLTRFTMDGAILWQSGGRDIFTGSLELGEELVFVEDFNGHVHAFSYGDGTNAA